MKRAPLADLHAFATVARLRGFRPAAQALGVSPSALSHALRGLEARMGVRLLNRSTRSVAPTEAGLRLLARLAPALDEIDQALAEVDDYRDTPQGTLRINAPRHAAEYLLAPLAARFLRDNPRMRLEIVGDNGLVDIVAEGFDAGVRFGNALDRDMVALRLGPPQRFVVVGAPTYLAARGEPAHPRDLAGHACIGIRFPSGRRFRWEFMRGDERLELDVDGPLVTSESAVLLRAAEDGLGLAFVYETQARPAIAAGRLRTVLDDWRPAEPGFYLYYPERRLMPPGLRAFIELARAEAADRDSG